MDTIEAIEREFKSGDLILIDAIERLEVLGLAPKEAEAKAYSWEEAQ